MNVFFFSSCVEVWNVPSRTRRRTVSCLHWRLNHLINGLKAPQTPQTPSHSATSEWVSLFHMEQQLLVFERRSAILDSHFLFPLCQNKRRCRRRWYRHHHSHCCFIVLPVPDGRADVTETTSSEELNVCRHIHTFITGVSRLSNVPSDSNTTQTSRTASSRRSDFFFSSGDVTSKTLSDRLKSGRSDGRAHEGAVMSRSNFKRSRITWPGSTRTDLQTFNS